MTAGDCCHTACLDKLNKLPADVRIDAIDLSQKIVHGIDDEFVPLCRIFDSLERESESD